MNRSKLFTILVLASALSACGVKRDLKLPDAAGEPKKQESPLPARAPVPEKPMPDTSQPIPIYSD